MTLSSDRSATNFFSLPFSSSNSFNRRISSGNSPSYFLFQLKYVAWLIPALRQISQAHLNRIALRLNQRPRKTLGFETPADRLRLVLP